MSDPLDHELVDPGAADEDDVGDHERDHPVYLKYMFEGVASIAALSTRLRDLADDLERQAQWGWYLAAPIDAGWAHLVRDVGNDD